MAHQQVGPIASAGMAAIMVLTAGSTGDIEPFAAQAGRLVGRGHAVTLAADAGFERLAPAAEWSSHRFAPTSLAFTYARAQAALASRRRFSGDPGHARGQLDGGAIQGARGDRRPPEVARSSSPRREARHPI